MLSKFSELPCLYEKLPYRRNFHFLNYLRANLIALRRLFFSYSANSKFNRFLYEEAARLFERSCIRYWFNKYLFIWRKIFNFIGTLIACGLSLYILLGVYLLIFSLLDFNYITTSWDALLSCKEFLVNFKPVVESAGLLRIVSILFFLFFLGISALIVFPFIFLIHRFKDFFSLYSSYILEYYKFSLLCLLLGALIFYSVYKILVIVFNSIPKNCRGAKTFCLIALILATPIVLSFFFIVLKYL